MPARDEREDLLRVLRRDDRAPPRSDVGQGPERHRERHRHLVEAVDRDRLLAALDLPNELAAERRAVAQPLLAEAAVLPQLAQALPQELSDVRNGAVTHGALLLGEARW